MALIKEGVDHKEAEVVLKYMDAMMRNNKNYLAVFTGGTGSGKSYSCLRLSELWYKYYFKGREFPKENICFSVSNLVDRLDSGELKKGDILIAEEIGVGANSKNFQSQTNKALQYILQSFRSLNIIVFFNVPHFSFFDKTARMLMHSNFQTVSIDKQKEICLLKPYFLSISQHTGKIYPKWLRIKSKKGLKIKVTKLQLYKPSDPIIKIYEGMKDYFVRTLINEMKILMACKQEKENNLKELTPKQEEVFQLLLKGLKTGEIAEKLGRIGSDISHTKTSIKKKGYVWSGEAKAEKEKELKEIENFL